MRGVRSHMAAGGTTGQFQHVERNADLPHTFFFLFRLEVSPFLRASGAFINNVDLNV